VREERVYQFVNTTRSSVLATTARVADTSLTRLRGLLFTKEIQRGEGLFLTPCNSIHMFGMTYAIDAVFVDKNCRVVAALKAIRPWRMSPVYWRAAACLELPPGTINDTGTEPGDQLERVFG